MVARSGARHGTIETPVYCSDAFLSSRDMYDQEPTSKKPLTMHKRDVGGLHKQTLVRPIQLQGTAKAVVPCQNKIILKNFSVLF